MYINKLIKKTEIYFIQVTNLFYLLGNTLWFGAWKIYLVQNLHHPWTLFHSNNMLKLFPVNTVSGLLHNNLWITESIRIQKNTETIKIYYLPETKIYILLIIYFHRNRGFHAKFHKCNYLSLFICTIIYIIYIL